MAAILRRRDFDKRIFGMGGRPQRSCVPKRVNKTIWRLSSIAPSPKITHIDIANLIRPVHVRKQPSHFQSPGHIFARPDPAGFGRAMGYAVDNPQIRFPIRPQKDFRKQAGVILFRKLDALGIDEPIKFPPSHKSGGARYSQSTVNVSPGASPKTRRI